MLLKAGKVMKLTKVGRLFHTLMTLLAKKFILTVQSLRGLFENGMLNVTSPNTFFITVREVHVAGVQDLGSRVYLGAPCMINV